MPSWPGARSSWAIAFGERTEKVGPSSRVDGTLLPSQNSIVKGRSGKLRSISRRSGSVRAKGIVPEPTGVVGATVP